MLQNFRYNHIPAILLAAAFCYPSIAAVFLSPSAVLTSNGFPTHIASSEEAWVVDAAGNARMLCLGGLMFYFYRRGDYRVLDTFLASASTIGIVECLALWDIGNRTILVPRFIVLFVFSVLGAAQTTELPCKLLARSHAQTCEKHFSRRLSQSEVLGLFHQRWNCV
ncbi:hypothetical protein NCS56_00332600 [Fusarium sp. Ph1]|nr:hypothetical protein NCS56_00332600 [Fusarium sp. Ph1]